MSKRFGRNQRRRAREALAAAEQRNKLLGAAMELDRGLMARLRSKLNEAEDFQKDVAELVGHEAIIAGELTTLPMKWDGRDGDRILYSLHTPFSMSMRDSRADYGIYRMRNEVLRLLDIEVVAEKMRQQVHARITLADKRVGYAISESALRRMPREQLRRTIGEPMLELLVDELMKMRK